MPSKFINGVFCPKLYISLAVETLTLAIFGQILAMKPPIFGQKFQDFPKKKKKNFCNQEWFQENYQKTWGGFKKTIIFSKYIIKSRIWNANFAF